MSFESLQAGLSVDVESFLFGFWDTCTCAFWLLDILYRISCIMHLLSIAIVPALEWSLLYYFSGIVYCPSTLGSWELCKSPYSSVKCNPSSVHTLLRPIRELHRFEPRCDGIEFKLKIGYTAEGDWGTCV